MAQVAPNYYCMLPQEVWKQLLTFPEYPDFVRFISTCKDAQALREQDNNSLERHYFSQVKIFDSDHWVEYWNAVITYKIEIRVLRAFLNTYWGAVPKELGKEGKVKDHCLIPTVKPHKVKSAGKVSNYCLKVLEDLSRQCKKGHAAKYTEQTKALTDYGMEGAKSTELILLLKGVFARDKSWLEQVRFLKELNVECVTEPDALSQNTGLLTHHAVTGEYPFGDDTGMEGKVTFGRTREEVEFPEVGRPEVTRRMISGHFSPSIDQQSPIGELEVCSSDFICDEDEGVAVMWKFPLKSD